MFWHFQYLCHHYLGQHMLEGRIPRNWIISELFLKHMARLKHLVKTSLIFFLTWFLLNSEKSQFSFDTSSKVIYRLVSSFVPLTSQTCNKWQGQPRINLYLIEEVVMFINYRIRIVWWISWTILPIFLLLKQSWYLTYVVMISR